MSLACQVAILRCKQTTVSDKAVFLSESGREFYVDSTVQVNKRPMKVVS